MLSLTWLVPSVRKPPPEITKKLHRRAVSAQPQEPLLLMGLYEKAKFVPTPEPIYHVSFDEQATVVPPPASESAPSSPRGRRLIPLPRCKSRTVQSEAVSLLPVSAPVTPNNSPLSSAETLTETPTEIKRTFSGRNVPQRGRFGFLKKSRTIDVRNRGGMLFLFGLLVFNLTLLSQLSVRVAIVIGPLPYHFLRQLPSHRMSCHHPNRSFLFGVQTPQVQYHHTSQSALSNRIPNIAA